jgi:hypothetical protein
LDDAGVTTKQQRLDDAARVIKGVQNVSHNSLEKQPTAKTRQPTLYRPILALQPQRTVLGLQCFRTGGIQGMPIDDIVTRFNGPLLGLMCKCMPNTKQPAARADCCQSKYQPMPWVVDQLHAKTRKHEREAAQKAHDVGTPITAGGAATADFTQTTTQCVPQQDSIGLHNGGRQEGKLYLLYLLACAFQYRYHLYKQQHNLKLPARGEQSTSSWHSLTTQGQSSTQAMHTHGYNLKIQPQLLQATLLYRQARPLHAKDLPW